jgi:hypothetical protein
LRDVAGHAYQAVGMQSLINIIRGIGASNIIQVPAEAYADAYSCSATTSPSSCGFLDSADGVMVSDPLASSDPSLGSQLMGNTDNYPDENQDCETVACFNTTYAPVADVMPLDSGEMGVQNSNNTSGGFPLVQAFANWMDSHNESYYGAAWDTWSNIIGNYNGGSLNPYWGTWFYDHVTAQSPPPTPLLSRGLPVFYPGGPANGDTNNAANNSNYTESNSTYFGFNCPRSYSNGGCYVAQNLSSVPAVQAGDLSKLLITWDNGVNYWYDQALYSYGDIGNLYDFTIDGACQPFSTTTLPSTWSTLATVTGNTLRSRSWLLDMTDTGAGNSACNGNYNWIRINATSGDPNGWTNWQGKFELWDASRSTSPAGNSDGDSWMMYGDSITANISMDKDQAWGTGFARQINAWNSRYYPSFEEGGMGGRWAQDYASWIVNQASGAGTTSPGSTPWLPKTPAHFFILALGTNDCLNGGQGDLYNSFVTMIQNIMKSDPTRVVIVPTMPASPALQSGTNTVMVTNGNGGFTPTQITGNGQGPSCDTQIQNAVTAEQAVYGASHVMAGPDIWGATVGPSTHWNNDTVGNKLDPIHPYADTQGNGILLSAWVKWAEQNVYGTSIK